jgi:hypothetical protein
MFERLSDRYKHSNQAFADAGSFDPTQENDFLEILSIS